MIKYACTRTFFFKCHRLFWVFFKQGKTTFLQKTKYTLKLCTTVQRDYQLPVLSHAHARFEFMKLREQIYKTCFIFSNYIIIARPFLGTGSVFYVSLVEFGIRFRWYINLAVCALGCKDCLLTFLMQISIKLNFVNLLSCMLAHSVLYCKN